MNLRVFDGCAPRWRRRSRDPGDRSARATGAVPGAPASRPTGIAADRLHEALPAALRAARLVAGRPAGAGDRGAAPARVRRAGARGQHAEIRAGGDWPHGLEPEVLQRFARRAASRTGADAERFPRAAAARQPRRRRDTAAAARGAASAGRRRARGADGGPGAARGRGPARAARARSRCRRCSSRARTIASRLRARRARWRRLLPGAHLVELRRAGHAPFLSHLDTLLPELQSFVAA